MDLTKQQEKEFAIYIDLADIRKFIKDNQVEYDIFEKLEKQSIIFGTCEMFSKVNLLNMQNKTFEILKMVL